MSKKPYRINGKDVVVKAENAVYANTNMPNVADAKGALDNLNERVGELEENGGGISTEDIVDNLTDGGRTKALSAEQGKVLNNAKQDKLVSGSSIKTVNNQSLLGGGNITIPKGDKGDTGNCTITDAGEMVSEIVNDLSTGGAAKFLSAEMGVRLQNTKQPRMEIFVAASNAPDWQKQGADFICDGTNDEVEIQAAINMLYNTGGRIRLSNGTFYIDSFQNTGGVYGNVALIFPNDKNAEFTLEGDQLPLSRDSVVGGTIIRVSNALYDSLSADTPVSMVGAVAVGIQYASHLSLRIGFIRFAVPWNQKKIMCIDTFQCARAEVYHVDCCAYSKPAYDPNWTPVNQGDNGDVCPIPVQGCVGIRTVGGGNWGSVADYRNIFVSGFYEGFKMAGEHLIGINLSAMWCYYPFTFGNFGYTGSSGHPMTLINICEEHCCCGPYFAHADNQEIDIIGFNSEVIPSRTPGGARLKEATIQSGHEGEFHGFITYTSMYGHYANEVGAPFWEPGQVHYFKTKNMLHRPSADSATIRDDYTPDRWETVWSVSANCMLIYDPTANAWKNMSGQVIIQLS